MKIGSEPCLCAEIECVQDEQTKARKYYKCRLFAQWALKVQSALVILRFCSCTLYPKSRVITIYVKFAR